MRLTLSRSACERRLTVTLAGPVSYAHRRAALDRVAGEAAGHGISRILVDFSLAWHVVAAPEDKEAFFLALRARTSLAGARIAYVNCPEGHVAELRSVAEDVGFAARMFFGRSSAIEWLEASGPATDTRPRSVATRRTTGPSAMR